MEVSTKRNTDFGRRSAERIQIVRSIRLEFSDVSEFMNAVADNISESGMFIRTAAVNPVGSTFRFRLALAEGDPMIEDFGEVVWHRSEEQESGGPTGMGIRFLSLVGESAGLVRRIVAEHRRMGRAPFYLEG